MSLLPLLDRLSCTHGSQSLMQVCCFDFAFELVVPLMALHTYHLLVCHPLNGDLEEQSDFRAQPNLGAQLQNHRLTRRRELTLPG